MIILKKGRLVTFNGIHLPNPELLKEVDENRQNYLGILELDKIN